MSAAYYWTSNPKRAKGSGMFGNERCFLKHISGFHFVISFFFLVFPPIFTWQFVALKNSSWRPLRVVETLGGRFRFTLLHNGSPRHPTQAVYYESDINCSNLILMRVELAVPPQH